MDPTTLSIKHEQAALADQLARIRSRIDCPEILEPDPDQQLPSNHRLTQYLAGKGCDVSEPRIYPEGVSIVVSPEEPALKPRRFQSVSLRACLLEVVEWIGCGLETAEGGES